MRITDLLETEAIKLSSNQRAKEWIQRVYDLYPGTWQNNHVMAFGDGEDKVYCVFELAPSMVKRDAVEVKWIQAMPMRSGAGTKCMQELQRLARESGITLTLYPWDKGQVSQAKLTKFYKKQGYKPVVKGSKSMYWTPPDAEQQPQG